MTHLLDIHSLSPQEIEHYLTLAENLKEVLHRPIPKVPTLRGKLVLLLFYEPSTRTKFSFERACKILSADIMSFQAKGSSLEKGESLLDTVKNLKALGINLIVIRHNLSGTPHFLAKHLDLPIVNAGDGIHEHPTQALLDLLTVKEKLGTLTDLRVVIVGDIKHSRVAHSDILAFQKMGSSVIVVGPAHLLPTPSEAEYFKLRSGGFKVCYSLKEALKGADVLIALRVQKERHQSPLLPSEREYHLCFGLRWNHLELLKEGALLLHPGPINWGIELDPSLEKYPFQVILEQVENGVAIRMAVLLTLLSGA